MTDEIVVGVDRSMPSRAALRWSVRRARSTGGSLKIVHVIETGASGDRARTFVEEEARFARDLDAGVEVSVEVAEGDPAEELTGASQDAELVVVGTHKTGFVHGNVYGSKFLGLAASAEHASAFIPESFGRVRTGVIVGIEESEVGLELIRFAAGEAARTSEDLLLIGCSAVDGPDVGLADPRPPSSRQSYTGQLSWAISVARAIEPTVGIRGRYSNRPVAESLIRAAAAASLLVVGSGPRRSGGFAPLGTVALDVLLNISSPVIVLQTRSALAGRSTPQPVPGAVTRNSGREPFAPPVAMLY